jgi:hypothetical protein
MKKGIRLVAGGLSVAALVAVSPAFATGGEEPLKCNSGRGNSSDTNTVQLINPHAGGNGPGVFATVDCDPGNSGAVNRGGD